jgi:hypothetical protein
VWGVGWQAPRLEGGRRKKAKPGPIIKSLGLVYSRFEFNRYPNPYYRPGPFSLKVT